MQGGFPLPHPDAIEIKTVPEQIIKVLALYIDEGGITGRDLLVCASEPSRPRREGQRPVPYGVCASALRLPLRGSWHDGVVTEGAFNKLLPSFSCENATSLGEGG